MPKDLVEAQVASLPPCDFCRANGHTADAQYDFRTTSGQWAYGCEGHYKQHRMYAELGTGKGQRLVGSKQIK